MATVHVCMLLFSLHSLVSSSSCFDDDLLLLLLVDALSLSVCVCSVELTPLRAFY